MQEIMQGMKFLLQNSQTEGFSGCFFENRHV